MRDEQFIEELKSYKGQFKNDNGLIRHQEGQCPICFLHFTRTRKKYDNTYYFTAGRELGLHASFILDIVDSADGRSNKYRKELEELCQ